MLMINGELCYSPFPPERYGDMSKRLCLWILCRGDMQLWNLLYLSFPQLDRHLWDGADHKQIIHSIDTKEAGAVVALVQGEYCTKTYNVRAMLRQTPGKFLAQLQKLDLNRLPPYKDIPNWLQRVEQRVLTIDKSLSVRDIEADLYRRLNVKLTGA